MRSLWPRNICWMPQVLLNVSPGTNNQYQHIDRNYDHVCYRPQIVAAVTMFVCRWSLSVDSTLVAVASQYQAASPWKRDTWRLSLLNTCNEYLCVSRVSGERDPGIGNVSVCSPRFFGPPRIRAISSTHTHARVFAWHAVCTKNYHIERKILRTRTPRRVCSELRRATSHLGIREVFFLSSNSHKPIFAIQLHRQHFTPLLYTKKRKTI